MNDKLKEFQKELIDLMSKYNVELYMSMEYIYPNDFEAQAVYRFSIPDFKEGFEIDELIRK